MSAVNYPHCPAAFINAIADEGSKAEAIEWLQRTWNELCAVRAELSALQAKVAAGEKDAQDAARYRWLRALSDANQFEVYDMARAPLLMHTEYLDAAIDAAISAHLPSNNDSEK